MRTSTIQTPTAFFLASLLLLGCGPEEKPVPQDPIVLPPVVECTSASGVSKGPWVLRVDGTSAVVRWEACRKGTTPGLSFTPEGGGDKLEVMSTETPFFVTATYSAALDPTAPLDQEGMFYMHDAVLTNLPAGTCHRYELAADPKAAGRFCTARPSGTPFRFLALADTNPGLNGITEKLLGQVVPQGFDFTVHAGDVQYYASGLETWASWFPRMEPLLAQGAFLPAVGNHELEKPEELDEYYKRFFGAAGFEGTDEYFRFESGGIWFFSLDTELDLTLTSPQGVWLAKSLADVAAKPGFRTSIVYFHKPWITCGDKSEDTTARSQFEPIFDMYGVRFVIQAHMHGYERFDLNGRTYITTGGGGGTLDDINANIDRPTCAQRVVSGAFRHAVLFDVQDTALTGTVIDETGMTRDTFTIPLGP